MINSLTGGLEFPVKNTSGDSDDLDIEKIANADINENYNPVPST
jgi:hypothetical protein